MSTDLTALSKAIAATGKWTPRPGQAVRDPETGTVFRLLYGDEWHEVGIPPDFCLGATPEFDDAEDRALAAGPWLDDEVTALSLLADLPGHRVWQPYGFGGVWICAPLGAAVVAESCSETRAAAIARAWIAAFAEALPKETP